jgi:hypothetical protein
MGTHTERLGYLGCSPRVTPCARRMGRRGAPGRATSGFGGKGGVRHGAPLPRSLTDARLPSLPGGAGACVWLLPLLGVRWSGPPRTAGWGVGLAVARCPVERCLCPPPGAGTQCHVRKVLPAVRTPSRGSGPPDQCATESNLVDPASSHMLLSRTKPCTSQRTWSNSGSVNGSLHQQQSMRWRGDPSSCL